MRLTPLAAALMSIVPLVSASEAVAAPAAGGAAAPSAPVVAAVTCADGRSGECSRGAELRIAGSQLHMITRVRFLGRAGRRDDRVATPQQTLDGLVTVVIPRRSNSGPVEVRGEGGIARTEPIRITATAAGAGAGEPASAGERVFPIVGRHDYGTEINRFGGGRGHQGQDVFAACGAKLVAAESGRVLMSTFQARAGNYLVLQHADGRATAYMHMRSAPLVAKGDRVQAGDPIGEVGDTGRASGCHLHFELWTAPGWYRGGQAIDPLPFLRELDDQLR